MRMRQKVVADGDSAINDDMCKQHCVLADFDFLLNDDICANVRTGFDPGRRMDYRRRMNSRSVLRRPIEKFESAGKIQIWILAAQHRRRKSREVLGHDYTRSSGAARQSCVLGIRNKCKLPWSGSFDRSNAGDFSIRRSVFETCAKCGGDVRE